MDTTAMRIGDAERERAALLLNEHVGAGRLDLAEFERRVDAVYTARTRGELAATTADLPTPSPQRAPRPDHRRILRYAAWGPLVLTSVICMVIWTATSLASGHPLYFWPMWVIGPWAATFLVGGAFVGGRCPVALHGRR
jgi:hypothetical protein